MESFGNIKISNQGMATRSGAGKVPPSSLDRCQGCGNDGDLVFYLVPCTTAPKGQRRRYIKLCSTCAKDIPDKKKRCDEVLSHELGVPCRACRLLSNPATCECTGCRHCNDRWLEYEFADGEVCGSTYDVTNGRCKSCRIP